MKEKSKYKKLLEAKEIFGIMNFITLKEIKAKFWNLSHQWHPDKCKEDKNKCNEMIQKIKESYDILIEYCDKYQLSFKEEDIKKYNDCEDYWVARFGDDPLWGGNNNSENDDEDRKK